MIGRRGKGGVIDAAALLDERDRVELAGERGAVDLGGRSKKQPGAKPFLLMSGAVVVALAGLVTAQAVNKRHEGEKKPASEQVVKNLKPGFMPAAVATEADGAAASPPDQGGLINPADFQAPSSADAGRGGAVLASATGPGANTGAVVPALQGGQGATPGGGQMQSPPQPRAPTAAELVHLRRLGADFGAGPSVASRPVRASADAAPSEAGGELGGQLKPMRLSAQAAGKLANPDFMLTQGAMLDCVLETKIVSTVAGMTSCHLTRDVYSTNGRVVVLDRGSKVVGFYQGGVRQGQGRIFVQWSRVETPKGVIINLDSPGTGPLGEGGVDGYIDTHFKDRFGGAILMSLIDDTGDYFANRSRSSDSQTFQLGNSSSAAQELARTALANSVNIPPTLYKNQGERVAIFVARDLDFRGVYELARR